MQGAPETGAGTCLGRVYWKGGISCELGPFPQGFALLHWVKKRKKKEHNKKKRAVFPEMCCVYGLMYFLNQLQKK